MDLYKELLAQILAQQEVRVVFPNLEINATEIVELESYQTIQKIKAVLCDDSLDDAECFMKIEKIICLFEQLGTGAGVRHDFG